MIRRPPRSTRTDTLFPYTTLFRSLAAGAAALTAGSIQAQAQDAGSEPVILTGGVTFLTDYRLRGASLSDNKPVIQGVVSAKIPVAGAFSISEIGRASCRERVCQ